MIRRQNTQKDEWVENTPKCYECARELQGRKYILSPMGNQVFCSIECQNDLRVRLRANQLNSKLQEYHGN